MSSENYLETLVEGQERLTEQARKIYGYQCSECNGEIRDPEILRNIGEFKLQDDEVLCLVCYERYIAQQMEDRGNPDEEE